LLETKSPDCSSVKELKNITFTKDKLKYDDSLGEIIKALGIMALVDLKSLPAENLENIRLLIAVCNDCNSKIRNKNDIIAQLDFDIFELLSTNEKLEVIDSYRKSHENEIKELKNNYDQLKDEYIKVHESLNDQLKTAIEKLKENENQKDN